MVKKDESSLFMVTKCTSSTRFSCCFDSSTFVRKLIDRFSTIGFPRHALNLKTVRTLLLLNRASSAMSPIVRTSEQNYRCLSRKCIIGSEIRWRLRKHAHFAILINPNVSPNPSFVLTHYFAVMSWFAFWRSSRRRLEMFVSRLWLMKEKYDKQRFLVRCMCHCMFVKVCVLGDSIVSHDRHYSTISKVNAVKRGLEFEKL